MILPKIIRGVLKTMKKLERILIYSVLAILVFYVFLVDGNVESQAVIQEEIRASRIIIVNDEGQEVIMLCADSRTGGGGRVDILNGNGASGLFMSAGKKGGGIGVKDKYGNLVITIFTVENTGTIAVCDRDGKVIGTLP